jgi:hypothetical protein
MRIMVCRRIVQLHIHEVFITFATDEGRERYAEKFSLHPVSLELETLAK